MHFKSMLEAFTLFVLYVIVAANCHKIWCNEMVLAAFIGQISYSWNHFLSYMSQDCLFNIRIKLILVEIGSEDRLIWITEKTSTYSCAGAWNCMRKKYPKVKWWRSSSDRGGATAQNFKKFYYIMYKYEKH